MKRRSLLGLLAAALCPVPPPGLPASGKPKKTRMAGSLNDILLEYEHLITAGIQRRVLKTSPWVSLAPEESGFNRISETVS